MESPNERRFKSLWNMWKVCHHFFFKPMSWRILMLEVWPWGKYLFTFLVYMIQTKKWLSSMSYKFIFFYLFDKIFYSIIISLFKRNSSNFRLFLLFLVFPFFIFHEWNCASLTKEVSKTLGVSRSLKFFSPYPGWLFLD